jgi:hypothetical protein
MRGPLPIPACFLAAILCLFAPVARAQTPAKDPNGPGVLVDQVVAVVNGDLVLESDLDDERRFAVFQPFSDPSNKFSRSSAVDRLIDRALILQQARLQPDDQVTLDDARAQLKELRKDLPACKRQCASDAGWAKFVAAQGFTIPEVEARWRERMQILKFIEMRFRAGIRIEPAQIKDYYTKTMLPEYKKEGANPPPLDEISDRIQEILLQQQVSNLLGDWLTSLKAEGNVRLMKPGEEAP